MINIIKCFQTKKVEKNWQKKDLYVVAKAKSVRYLDPVPELFGEPVLLPVLGHAPRHLLLQHLHHDHDHEDLDAANDEGSISFFTSYASFSSLYSINLSRNQNQDDTHPTNLFDPLPVILWVEIEKPHHPHQPHHNYHHPHHHSHYNFHHPHHHPHHHSYPHLTCSTASQPYCVWRNILFFS